MTSSVRTPAARAASIASLAMLGGCDLVFELSEPPDAELPAGLIVHYTMDEVIGNQVIDMTGRGHTALCQQTRCPTVVEGLFDNALQFDGTSTFLRAESMPDLRDVDAFTVSLWVFLDGLPSGALACAASKVYESGVENSWQVCFDPSARLFFITFDGTLPDVLATPTPFSLARWHHVALRWDGEKTIFVDGFPEVMRVVGTVFDDGAVTFGSDIDDGAPGSFLAGAIDEVQIYDRALTNNEIGGLARLP